MERYLICGLLGLVSGLVFYLMAVHHVKVRNQYDDGGKLAAIKRKKNVVVWILVAEVLLMYTCTMGMDYWQIARFTVFGMLAFNVAVVDLLLRRIPNSVLLSMLILQIGHMVVSVNVYHEETQGVVYTALIGFLLAYIMFLLPALLRLSVGAGDVKYSAVIGFTLGFTLYVEAMLVMAAAIMVFYIYLKITKTGNIKTAAPMAPFLSIGALVAFIAPIF